METQNWKDIKKQIEFRKEAKIDTMIAKCFFKAGWNVYPEAGHRFQLKRDYEDCEHIDSISNDEAKMLWISFLKELELKDQLKIGDFYG